MPEDSVATMRQMAGLLAAGLSLRKARSQLELQLGDLLESESKQFERIWNVVSKSGGPAVGAVSRLADVLDAQRKSRNEIALAYAAPKSTARLVTLLPVITLALAQLVGLDPLSVIVEFGIGTIAVAMGCALLWLGHRWSAKMLLKAAPEHQDPGAFLDCLAAACQGGLPQAQARALVIEQCEFPNSLIAEDELLIANSVELSRTQGIGLAALLTSAADSKRERQRFEDTEKIAKLSVSLMIPLGLAVLPAFVLITIVPIAIGLMRLS